MVLRPLTYRAEIVRPILERLNAGECCSVVGINGVGKTNALQQLQRPEVLAHYGVDAANPLTFLTLDANMLTGHDGWAFFEGLTEALVSSQRDHVSPQVWATVHEAQLAIFGAPDSYTLAFRRCEEALRAALSLTRLVIIFDEFDPLFVALPELVLRNLRGLRDRYKYRLMYLTFSRERLTELRSAEDWDQVESFVELLTLGALGLGPLNPDDALGEVRRFAGRHQGALDERVAGEIVALSGGHPALIRALTRAALDGLSLREPMAVLNTSPDVAGECHKILNALSSEEYEGLWRVQRGIAVDRDLHQDLTLKGLAQQTGGRLRIFSPLIGAALDRQATRPVITHGAGQPAEARPLLVDIPSQRVRYYEHEIGGQLSDLQFRLIGYLYERWGELCSFADVAQAVYGQDLFLVRESLSILVRRLASYLRQLAPGQPALLHVHRGRGYRLGLPTGDPGAPPAEG